MTAIRWAWLVAPEPAARLRVTSSDGTGLNVEVHGPQDAPAPTVVLIHGWTCSIPLWSRVIYALRGDLRIAAYDQRGHGASEKGGRYSVDVLADDLAAVLDATLRPGEKAVLAGHSMGGMAIMAAAPREAVLSRVSGALLASTGYADLVPAARVAPRGRQFPRLAALAHRQLLTSAAPMGPVTRLSAAALKYATLGPDAPDGLAAVNAAIIQSCDRRVRAAWGRVLATLDVGERARHLDVPAHVIVGTADRLTPPPQARRIAERLPQCTGLTELPGAGHMTPLERPEAVADAVRKLTAEGAQVS